MKNRLILLIVICFMPSAPLAYADSQVVRFGNIPINLPAPDGYKNVIGTPIGKSIASGYSTKMNKPLAFFVPSSVNLSRGDKMNSYIVFTISRMPGQLEPTSSAKFVGVLAGIKSMAKRDNVKVLHESPNEIILMSYLRDESVPYYKASSIFLVRDRILNFKFIQASTGRDDIKRIKKEAIGWITKIRTANTNSARQAQASTVGDDPGKHLEQSLTFNSETHANMMDGIDLVAELSKAGIFSDKPDYRMDYSSYHLPKKDVSVLGAKLVYFGHEYMVKYIGCCVNRGNTVFLIAPSDMTKIEEFSEKNKCKIDRGTHVYMPDGLSKILKIPHDQLSQYIEISCRARDRSLPTPRY